MCAPTFTERSLCHVCLMPDHIFSDCPNGFLCFNCFHTHGIGAKCDCVCYLETVKKVSDLSEDFKPVQWNFTRIRFCGARGIMG